MIFSDYILNNLRFEIEILEDELNYYHNTDILSPGDKYVKIIDILKNISEKNKIIELYLNYLLQSKQNENDNGI